MKKHIIIIASLLILSSCTSFQRADDAATARKQMLGMSREDVLICMGIPKKKATEGAVEVWSYLSTDESGTNNSDTFKTTGYAHTTGTHSREFCTVNVVMKNGTVTRINYNGPSGGVLSPNEQCGYAIENCLTPE